MDRGACRATVHGFAKESDTTEQLSYSLTHVSTSQREMTQAGEHSTSWRLFIAETEDIAEKPVRVHIEYE